MVKKEIAKLKTQVSRTSNKLRWRPEWLKEERVEIVKRLSILFKNIEREQRTLTQWRHTTIQSKDGNKVNISES